MSEPLRRAQALLALAAKETSEEAARTAAVEAARLIAKHGFRLEANSPASGAGASTVHIPFSPSWNHLFWLADPERGSPEVFCAVIRWSSIDLVRMVRDRQSVSKEKLNRLFQFCSTRRVAIPFGPEHPAYERLGLGHSPEETSIEKAVGSITVRDLVNLFRG